MPSCWLKVNPKLRVRKFLQAYQYRTRLWTHCHLVERENQSGVGFGSEKGGFASNTNVSKFDFAAANARLVLVL